MLQLSLFLYGISNDFSDQWYLEMMVRTSENWLPQKLEYGIRKEPAS